MHVSWLHFWLKLHLMSFFNSWIINPSLRIMSFLPTWLLKRLGLALWGAVPSSLAGPDGFLAGLLISIWDFRLPFLNLDPMHSLQCGILSWCIINDSLHNPTLYKLSKLYAMATEFSDFVLRPTKSNLICVSNS